MYYKSKVTERIKELARERDKKDERPNDGMPEHRHGRYWRIGHVAPKEWQYYEPMFERFENKALDMQELYIEHLDKQIHEIYAYLIDVYSENFEGRIITDSTKRVERGLKRMKSDKLRLEAKVKRIKMKNRKTA